jgi:hypothetical protein
VHTTIYTTISCNFLVQLIPQHVPLSETRSFTSPWIEINLCSFRHCTLLDMEGVAGKQCIFCLSVFLQARLVMASIVADACLVAKRHVAVFAPKSSRSLDGPPLSIKISVTDKAS